MALNNDVETGAGGEPLGDPTEIALRQAVEAAGVDRAAMARDWPRVREIPFDAERRRMTTIHNGPAGPVAMVKGAPEGGSENWQTVAFTVLTLSQLALCRSAGIRVMMITRSPCVPKGTRSGGSGFRATACCSAPSR